MHATESVTLCSGSPSKLIPASSFVPLPLPSDGTPENCDLLEGKEIRLSLGETMCLPKNSVSWPNIWEII